MAFDPCPSAAAQRIAEQTPLHFGRAHDIVGISEYELKLNFAPEKLSFIDSGTAIKRGEKSFFNLMKSFEQASSGAPKTFFDPAGLLPNDYVLVSLGLDTVKTLPMAEFFLNDMQYRLRFPLFPHNTNEPGSPLINLASIDANLKDRLSKMEQGEHRIELEKTINTPTECLNEFKELNNLPHFMHNINDEDLRVSEVCMTSRVGFFMMTKVPDTDAHVLLHGCFDVSRYTTPAMEVYTDPMPRIEVELEAKLFFGESENLSEESVQKEYINRVFSKVIESSKSHNFSVFEKSKMEDAAHSVEKFYARHAPEVASATNSPMAAYCARKNIDPYLAYALSQGKRVSDVFNAIIENGTKAPIVQLASALPNPQKLLVDANPFLAQEHAYKAK